MPYILGNCPYIKCFARREFLHDRMYGHGQFVHYRAHAVQCERGNSLWFNGILGPAVDAELNPIMRDDGKPLNYGGCHFRLPITALVGKPCPPPATVSVQQPWDSFGHDFGICEQDFTVSGAAFVLPDWAPAQYLFTVAFRGSDLSQDVDQHKYLHVVERVDGLIGAYPNNRLVIPDNAFWPMIDRDWKPDLESLDLEVRAEGHQDLFDPQIQPEFADVFKQAFPELDSVEEKLAQRAVEIGEALKEPA